MNHIIPGSIDMANVKFDARTDEDCKHNFDLLLEVFIKNGIPRVCTSTIAELQVIYGIYTVLRKYLQNMGCFCMLCRYCLMIVSHMIQCKYGTARSTYFLESVLVVSSPLLRDNKHRLQEAESVIVILLYAFVYIKQKHKIHEANMIEHDCFVR